jgi:hypothetical protein
VDSSVFLLSLSLELIRIFLPMTYHRNTTLRPAQIAYLLEVHPLQGNARSLSITGQNMSVIVDMMFANRLCLPNMTLGDGNGRT